MAGEACRAALEWAEANLEPTPIWAIIAPENAPSIKLAEKLGFERLNETLYHDEPTVVLAARPWLDYQPPPPPPPPPPPDDPPPPEPLLDPGAVEAELIVLAARRRSN